MQLKSRNLFPALLLAFTFSSFTSTTFAQTKTQKASIISGEEVDTKRSSITAIAGNDETGYYTVRTQGGMMSYGIFFEHIDKNMKVDVSTKLSKDDAPFYSFSKMMEGKLYLFCVEEDEDAKTITLSYQRVDKKTLVPEVEETDIAVSKVSKKRDVYRSGTVFLYNISPDESNMLVYTLNKEKNDNGELPSDTKFHLSVFNSSMAKQWEKDVKVPFGPDVFSVEQVKVDNNGNVYIIGIEYQEKTEARNSRREGKPSYTYHLYRYSNKGEEVLEMPLDLKGKFITDVQVDGAPNGDLIASGFYSEKGSFSIKGAFYMAIDSKTHDVKVQNMSEFDSEFITQYYSEKEKKKTKKKEEKGDEPELFSFDLNELLIRQDGGATLIAEQYYMYTRTYTTYDPNTHMSTTHTDYYYNYNDILVLSFNKDGSLAWKTKIPKRQTTMNDGGYYSSYSFAMIDDKLYFIFNDNPKNLFAQPGVKPQPFLRGSKELAVMLVQVDASGKATKELLMTTEKGDLIVRPKLCEQTAAREMLILGEKSKSYQFSKVVFK
jgi:hypothetical protein